MIIHSQVIFSFMIIIQLFLSFLLNFYFYFFFICYCFGTIEDKVNKVVVIVCF